MDVEKQIRQELVRICQVEDLVKVARTKYQIYKAYTGNNGL